MSTRLGVLHLRDHYAPLQSRIFECGAVAIVRRPLPGVGLPAVYDGVTIPRIVFQDTGLTAGHFRSDQGSSRSAEDIQDDLPSPRAILDRIRHQRDGLDRGMHGKFLGTMRT